MSKPQINNHSPLPTNEDIEKAAIAHCLGMDQEFEKYAIEDFTAGANWALNQSQETIKQLNERVKELEDGLRELHSCTYDLIEYCQDQTYVDFIEDLTDGAVEMNKAMDKARALLTPKNNGE